jgi:hypothetical protein
MDKHVRAKVAKELVKIAKDLVSNEKIARELVGGLRSVAEAKRLQVKLIRQFENEFKRRPSENMGDKYMEKFEDFIGDVWDYDYSDRQKMQALRKELFDIVTGVPE